MTVRIYRCAPNRTRYLRDWATENIGPGAVWAPIFSMRRRLPRSRKTIVVERTALPGMLFIRHDTTEASLAALGCRGAFPMLGPSREILTCDEAELFSFWGRIKEREQELLRLRADNVVPYFPCGAKVIVTAPDSLLNGEPAEVLTQVGETVTIAVPSFSGELLISSFLLAPFIG